MARIVITGAGLGGLECACILSKAGHEVTVLEQDAQAGGCLRSFRRGGLTFDTGMHYVGGLGEGEALGWLLSYFGLDSLPWIRLAEGCTDRVYLDGRSFDLASGPDNYIRSLGEVFPSEKDGLTRCVKRIMDIVSSVRTPLGEDDRPGLFGTSAFEFLRGHIKSPELIKVMAGASMRFLKSPETLSLYEFAMTNGSFLQSAWRLKGGGQQIADKLVLGLLAKGGKILTGAKVTGLKEEGGKLVYAEVSDGQRIPADIFISDIHPSVTLDLMEGKVRRSYKSRIYSLVNGPGVFTVNVKLKKGAVRYRGHNLHIHSGEKYAMVSFYVPSEGEYAQALDILSPASPGTFAARDEHYEELKGRLAAECINLACTALPELKDSIEEFWTSSPLTYCRFTGAPGGSAFGIVKDCRSPLTAVLSPRTPVPNLLLTGQSLNLHGALGVSMTALRTCAEILGNETINKEFNLI